MATYRFAVTHGTNIPQCTGILTHGTMSSIQRESQALSEALLNYMVLDYVVDITVENDELVATFRNVELEMIPAAVQLIHHALDSYIRKIRDIPPLGLMSACVQSYGPVLDITFETAN